MTDRIRTPSLDNAEMSLLCTALEFARWTNADARARAAALEVKLRNAPDVSRQNADVVLRACTVNQIAAELLWRASQPVASRPWRPFYLTHGEALALARHAADNALHEAHDRGEMVTADARGCEMLGGAALLVLEKIEPGRWRVEITVVSHGRSPDVAVTERESAPATTGPGPYGTRSPASLCWDCGRLVSAHVPGDICNASEVVP